VTAARWRVWSIAIAAAAATLQSAADGPYPARWIDAEGVRASGFGRVRFEARDGNALTAHVYRPNRFDAQNGPIWFVMHGASRDVERYIRVAAPAAERYGALAIAIHFPADLYPRQSDYTLGVTTSGEADEKAFAEDRWRPPAGYLYSELEHVFAAVRRTLGGEQSGYYVFGHSAGAQFTHRLLTFLPDAHVLGAVAANAGWYTLPTARTQPLDAMPYGLRGSPLERADLSGLFAAPFAIVLGERDTATAEDDDLVRGTPEALAQGANRLERGRFYHGIARERARAIGAPFAWRLAIAPRARHEAAHVIDSAAFLLFARREEPCIASAQADAGALSITEVLADPPDGPSGDANGDGTRDAADDEFVEIVNGGTTPVCLTGWTLGDAEEPVRHTFPIGRALAPGAALVVFGGGVPTGEFGNADVQTAAYTGSLNLSNAGDVLVLRDANDRLVIQLSWGDCSSKPCAADHWNADLAFGASIALSPEPPARWRPHVEVGTPRFTPGVRPDGSRW
jgi:hypothetical protein